LSRPAVRAHPEAAPGPSASSTHSNSRSHVPSASDATRSENLRNSSRVMPSLVTESRSAKCPPSTKSSTTTRPFSTTSNAGAGTCLPNLVRSALYSGVTAPAP
jgi:hypothetical protein